MAVDQAWMRRDLGIKTLAEPAALVASGADTDRSLMRELIDFDSESTQGRAFASVAPLSTGLDKFVDIDWPAGLAPIPATTAPVGESLPKADVLIVTWTMDEGHALAKVLSPGFDSKSDWKPYVKNYAQISADMQKGCPALEEKRLGTYWTTTIGAKTVTLFKSDSHMSQDGPKLPNATVWKQIIEDCSPSWVITTGTGGGIGAIVEVGDVIVSPYVTFSCKKEFKEFNGRSYVCPTHAPGMWTEAAKLFAYNAGFLPKDNTRPPKIVHSTSPPEGILTTDYFGFDNTANTYALQGHGDLSEMGDAVLGMVCEELGKDAPNYVIVRNVSDPEIDSTGLTLEQQAAAAALIYKGFGRWSSVCSAIVSWSIVAAL
jgi:nucleoside phosphorylase